MFDKTNWGSLQPRRLIMVLVMTTGETIRVITPRDRAFDQQSSVATLARAWISTVSHSGESAVADWRRQLR